jgi:hypothetical protein
MNSSTYSIKSLFATMTCMVSFAVQPQASGWERYQPSTFSKVFAELDKYKQTGELTVAPGTAAFSVDMHFTGKLRSIEKATIGFIDLWKTTYNIQANVKAIYTHEACFIDSGKELWFPIQSSLIQDLQSELPKGGMANIKIAWLGHISNDIVLVVNAYRSLEELPTK